MTRLLRNEHEGTEESTPLESPKSQHSNIDDEEECIVRDSRIAEMRQKIRYLKKIMYFSNASVLSFAVIVLLLYFFSHAFDGVKIRDRTNSCARAGVEPHAFEECSDVCDDHLCCFDDSCLDDDDGGGVAARFNECDRYSNCKPLYHLTSPEQHLDLENSCSQEHISSSEENMKECGEKCKISECCWKDQENCMGNHTKLCSVYLPCAIYYVNTLKFGMGIGPVIIEGGAVDKAYP